MRSLSGLCLVVLSFVFSARLLSLLSSPSFFLSLFHPFSFFLSVVSSPSSFFISSFFFLSLCCVCSFLLALSSLYLFVCTRLSPYFSSYFFSVAPFMIIAFTPSFFFLLGSPFYAFFLFFSFFLLFGPHCSFQRSPLAAPYAVSISITQRSPFNPLPHSQ